jgi:ATP-dependent DNA helicase RecQ
MREALPDRPHPSAIKAAFRVLSRHGYLDGGEYGYEATRPEELPGQYPPMDTEALERRATVERGKLKKMVEYAYDVGCRHGFVLRYFGDVAESERPKCAACDNCKGSGHARPLDDEQREHVVKLLNLVWRLDGRFGRTRLGALANGTDDDDRFIDLEERATLRGQSTAYLIDLLRSLEGAGLLSVSRGDYPTLSITGRGEEVVAGAADLGDMSIALSRRGKKPRKRKARGTESAPSVEGDADFDVALAERLKELRTSLAMQREVPAYVIFSNRTLEAIARAQPQSLGELSQVAGIGPAKLSKYGDAILGAIEA